MSLAPILLLLLLLLIILLLLLVFKVLLSLVTGHTSCEVILVACIRVVHTDPAIAFRTGRGSSLCSGRTSRP